MMFAPARHITRSTAFMMSRCVCAGACIWSVRSCVAKQMRLSTSNSAKETHGTENRQEEIEWEEVQPRRKQGRRKRDAQTQTGHASQRSGRQGRQGEEPQAGDRDRAVRSASERKEGSPQEGRTEAQSVEVVLRRSPVSAPATLSAAQ